VIVFEWIIGILLVAVLLSALAQRVGVPYPVLLALGGAVLAFTPGAPRMVLEPELALALFLALVLPRCRLRCIPARSQSQLATRDLPGARVREGPTVYDNLKKSIVFLLPINGGESLSIGVAILLGITLPITPLQVLWINMVSSLGLVLALAFEPTEPDAMSRPPRTPDEPIL